jgi:diamine N-acetyltransferase
VEAGVQIRPAELSDVPALASLTARVFAATYGAALRPEARERYLALRCAPEQMSAELRAPCQSTFVAWVAGQLLGYGVLAPSPPPACVVGPRPLELRTLYVDPAQHGRGIGRTLLAHSAQIAAQQGYGTLWLCVWEQNARARAFYARAGFAEVGHHDLLVAETVFHDRVLVRALPAAEERHDHDAR